MHIGIYKKRKIVKILTAIGKAIQEERSISWQVIVSVIVRKKMYLDMCSFF